MATQVLGNASAPYVPTTESSSVAKACPLKLPRALELAKNIGKLALAVLLIVASLTPGLSTIVFLPAAGYNALRARFCNEAKKKKEFQDGAIGTLILSIPILGNIVAGYGVCSGIYKVLHKEKTT